MGEKATRMRSLGLITGLALLLAGPSGAQASHADPGTLAWGYEAALSGARLFEYDIGSDTLQATCLPPGSVNGRGVELDPADGNLWYSVVKSGEQNFEGDGFIHKTARPPACQSVTRIPFADGTGGSVQDAIGAIDVDPDDGQLWVAGYQPIDERSFLYKIDRSTGAVLASCSVPFGGGGAGNDTLTEAKLSGLPGSGSYLLTDAGEAVTNPHALLAVDETSCAGGGPGTVVTTFRKVVTLTGIDYYSGKLLATDELTLFNLSGPTFSEIGSRMSTRSGTIEDISVQSDHPPDCSTATVTPETLFPPNHKLVSVRLGGVTDPDGDPVTIRRLGVSQDEPVQGAGDNTAPDAIAGAGDDQVSLRAERNPQGDGRVYRIAFRASDPARASCSGTVIVTVPTQPNERAVDSSPPSYDSFG